MKSDHNNINKRANILWISLIILVIIGGMVFFLIFLIPFEYQESLIDSISADGEVESYTRGVYTWGRYCSGTLALFLIGVLIFLLFYKERANSYIEVALASSRNFIEKLILDFKEILWAIFPSRTDILPIIVLIFITALAIFFRYAYLWRPMGHDETYTFMAFASRGLRYTISDYHLPNNHVFHTILVNLAYQLFGDSPAIIRLPAFLAGIFIIPATYMVGKIFYSASIALVAASVVASLPVMIDYSTTARGYPFLTLFTLLILASGVFVKEHKNLIGWILLVLFSCFGLYTNPTMIYPIGMVYTWLLLSKFINDVSRGYGRDYYLFLIISSVSIVILTGILYAPIIINSGLQSIVGNDVIEALSWSDFIQSVPVRVKNTWAEWNRDIPKWVTIIAICGLLASLFVPKLPKNRRMPLILAGILWIGTALIIQRVAPWPRIWLFLLPLFVIWISAGIIGLFDLFTSRISYGDYFMMGLVSILIIMPLAAGYVRSYSQYAQKLHSTGEVEQVAEFLGDYIHPNDVVVVTSPDTIVLKYYLRRYSVSREVTELTKGKDFETALVVVNLAHGQTIDYVLDRRSFFDDVSLETVNEIYRTKRFAIYQFSSK